ncbi:MAG: patatin-like phospholipase family protein, partial [Myxococcota bacterium]|nr:patatin-like phospholipase family protein [Myxococcota bacterium]
MYDLKGRIGLALGSGAARGWAHVGVIRALEERGIVPDIVCGSSAGALVGAMYAAGRLEGLEKFGQELDWRQMVGYFDVSLRGGLIRARKLLATLTAEFGSHDLASLGKPFGGQGGEQLAGPDQPAPQTHVEVPDHLPPIELLA